MIVAEFPRSGGSWVTYLLSYILNIPMIDLDSKTPRPSDPLRRELLLGNWDRVKHSGQFRVAKTHKLPPSIDYLDREKTVLLVRDGRDVMVSYFCYLHQTRWTLRRKGLLLMDSVLHGTDGFQRFLSQHVPRWAKHVESHVVGADHLLRYEDLLVAPVEELAALFRQMNLPVERDLVEHAVDLFSFENLSGGRQRGTEVQRAFFRKGVSGDWRKWFSERHLQIFMRVGGEEALGTLGYLN
ncbi:sulfotransferase domain-containing protein [Chloroflexota bacterium]